MTSRSPLGRRGSPPGVITLVGTIVITIFLLILTPLLLKMGRQNSRDSVRDRKSTTAFHLAEAAVERGYWKLTESPDHWIGLSEGTAIPGYNYDKTYVVEEGDYRIRLARGATINEALIVGTGREPSGEMRSIQAVYLRKDEDSPPGNVVAPIYAHGFNSGGNAHVYWGPIVSQGNISLSGMSNQQYPRKFSTLNISAVGGAPVRDTNGPAQPNKGPGPDPYWEWWTYNESPGVPSIPAPDFNYYRTKAQAQGLYFSGNMMKVNYVNNACTTAGETTVHFVEGNAALHGQGFLCGVFIVMGRLTWTGGGSGPDIIVTPPAQAWREYLVNVPAHANDVSDTIFSETGTHPSSCHPPHGDTPAAHEYPGDGGFHSSNEAYSFRTGCSLHNELATEDFNSDPLSFKGYVFVGGNFKNTGIRKIHGALHCAGSGLSAGLLRIFYDDSLNILGLDSFNEAWEGKPLPKSWHEIPPAPYP